MPLRAGQSHGIAPQSLISNYQTRTIKILVGEGETLFEVNKGFLDNTTFFLQHGQPLPRQSQLRVHTNELGSRSGSPKRNDSMFFDTAASDPTIDTEDGIVIDITDSDADYQLKDQFYFSPDAFHILVRHLSDASPVIPKNQEECFALFKAYALAARYEVPALQNQIIDALQHYYVQNIIPITDIIFITEHWGDTVEELLIGYLVAQAGYETAFNWMQYRQDNTESEALFASSNKVVIEHLFQAALSHAEPKRSDDPAKNKRDWRYDR